MGARHPEHLDGTAAADLELSKDDMKRIDEILSEAVPVTGPSPEGM